VTVSGINALLVTTCGYVPQPKLKKWHGLCFDTEDEDDESVSIAIRSGEKEVRVTPTPNLPE
jgi:hypothetical protein